ncbi:MAG TPA: hypothetical protein DCS71_04560 [Flavobacteriales bacterium]|nr:hypothetical protein [Flavobacteriales bacterium]
MRRKIQPVVRYKMNDILHATKCGCGSKMIAVSQIEGRTDDVLHFDGGRRIFPDFIRRAVIGSHRDISNYQIIQEDSKTLALYVDPKSLWDVAAQALTRLFETQQLLDIEIRRVENKTHIQGTKFRRIHAQRH